MKNGLFKSSDGSKVGIDVKRVVISGKAVDGSLLRKSLLFYDGVRFARRRLVDSGSRSTIYRGKNNERSVSLT